MPIAREQRKAQEDALKQHFSALDKNKDGKLGLGEIKELLQQGDPSMTDRECQMLFEQIDRNGDLTISFKEFVNYLTAVESETAEAAEAAAVEKQHHHEGLNFSNMTAEQLKGAFKKWDKNGDGKLNFPEMAALLRKGNPDLSDKDLEYLFSMADKDNNRRINLAEFIEYVKGSTLAAAGEGFTTIGQMGHAKSSATSHRRTST
mmetsp:Transcript_137492/g.293852  ORF Transcript_137492/g.293852 Transcript_137492/m.293852 type:complete len:204 (-) Transcript_137492:152-763(-)